MVEIAVRRRAPNHPTAAQIRAGRALVGMTAAQLAERANVAINTVKRAEAARGFAPITAANATQLLRVLEAAGVAFISRDGDAGEGVRLTSPSHEGV